MGSKEQGGLDRFKFKAAYNNLDKKFYISITDRKDPWLTQRINLDTEEFRHILNGMIVAYEDVIYPGFRSKLPEE